MLARWFSRILADPLLARHEETRALVEADFGYTPQPPGPGSSSAARKRFAAAIAGAGSAAAAAGPGLPNGVLAAAGAGATKRGPLSILGIGAKMPGTGRSVYDDDEDLMAARAEVTRLEMQFADAAEACEKLAGGRRGKSIWLMRL